MARNLLKLLFASSKHITQTAGQTLLHLIYKYMEFPKYLAKRYNKMMCMVGSEDNMFKIIHNRLEENAGFDSDNPKLEFNLNLTSTRTSRKLLQLVHLKPCYVHTNGHATISTINALKIKQPEVSESKNPEEQAAEINKLLANPAVNSLLMKNNIKQNILQNNTVRIKHKVLCGTDGIDSVFLKNEIDNGHHEQEQFQPNNNFRVISNNVKVKQNIMQKTEKSYLQPKEINSKNKQAEIENKNVQPYWSLNECSLRKVGQRKVSKLLALTCVQQNNQEKEIINETSPFDKNCKIDKRTENISNHILTKLDKIKNCKTKDYLYNYMQLETLNKQTLQEICNSGYTFCRYMSCIKENESEVTAPKSIKNCKKTKLLEQKYNVDVKSKISNIENNANAHTNNNSNYILATSNNIMMLHLAGINGCNTSHSFRSPLAAFCPYYNLHSNYRNLFYQRNYHSDKSKHYLNKKTKKRLKNNKEMEITNHLTAVPVVKDAGNSLINTVFKNAYCTVLSKICRKLLIAIQSHSHHHQTLSNQVIKQYYSKLNESQKQVHVSQKSFHLKANLEDNKPCLIKITLVSNLKCEKWKYDAHMSLDSNQTNVNHISKVLAVQKNNTLRENIKSSSNSERSTTVEIWNIVNHITNFNFMKYTLFNQLTLCPQTLFIYSQIRNKLIISMCKSKPSKHSCLPVDYLQLTSPSNLSSTLNSEKPNDKTKELWEYIGQYCNTIKSLKITKRISSPKKLSEVQINATKTNPFKLLKILKQTSDLKCSAPRFLLVLDSLQFKKTKYDTESKTPAKQRDLQEFGKHYKKPGKVLCSVINNPIEQFFELLKSSKTELERQRTLQIARECAIIQRRGQECAKTNIFLQQLLNSKEKPSKNKIKQSVNIVKSSKKFIHLKNTRTKVNNSAKQLKWTNKTKLNMEEISIKFSALFYKPAVLQNTKHLKNVSQLLENYRLESFGNFITVLQQMSLLQDISGRNTNSRKPIYWKKIVESKNYLINNPSDIKEQASILEINKKLIDNMEMIIQKNKIIEKLEKKIAECQNKNTHKSDPINHLNEIREQISILKINKKVFDDTDKIIRKIKIISNPKKRNDGCGQVDDYILETANIDDIKEQINTLEINKKVFNNIEKVLQKIKLVEKTKETPQAPQNKNKRYLLNDHDDIKERTSILEINEKVFDNMEEVIQKIKIIEKPKKTPEASQNKKPLTENTNAKQNLKNFRIFNNNIENARTNNFIKLKKGEEFDSLNNHNKCPLPARKADIENAIQMELKEEIEIIKKIMPELKEFNNSLQQIEIIQKEALALLCKQLIEQVCVIKENKAGANKIECQTLIKSTNMVEPATLDRNAQITHKVATNVTKHKQNNFESKQLSVIVDKTTDFTSKTQTLSSLTKHPQICDNSKSFSDSDLSEQCVEQDHHPRIRNIHNKLPIYFRKNSGTLILPETTFWNVQPKLNISGYNFNKQIKTKHHFSKKYRYETKEVKSLMGDKIKITRLISDNEGQ